MESLLPSFATLTLGFGVYIVVFTLCFLVSLPLLGERHAKGEDVRPLIWRIVFIHLAGSLALTIAGFWVVEFYDII